MLVTRFEGPAGPRGHRILSIRQLRQRHGVSVQQSLGPVDQSLQCVALRDLFLAVSTIRSISSVDSPALEVTVTLCSFPVALSVAET